MEAKEKLSLSFVSVCCIFAGDMNDLKARLKSLVLRWAYFIFDVYKFIYLKRVKNLLQQKLLQEEKYAI